jgi:hypothetical protein
MPISRSIFHIFGRQMVAHDDIAIGVLDTYHVGDLIPSIAAAK